MRISALIATESNSQPTPKIKFSHLFVTYQMQKKVQKLSHERPNLRVIQADVTKPSQLKSAAEAVSAITSGRLDVLIQNALIVDIPTIMLTLTAIPIVSSLAGFSPSFDQSIEDNILSMNNTTNIFPPLIRKGA